MPGRAQNAWARLRRGLARPFVGGGALLHAFGDNVPELLIRNARASTVARYCELLRSNANVIAGRRFGRRSRTAWAALSARAGCSISIFVDPLVISNDKSRSWQGAAFCLGGILPNLLGAAGRNHSSDCAGAKSGQFYRSADGDRFGSVWFGHGVDIDRPQNAVVQDKNSAADNGCVQGRSLT
jgi:hypothetical protein